MWHRGLAQGGRLCTDRTARSHSGRHRINNGLTPAVASSTPSTDPLRVPCRWRSKQRSSITAARKSSDRDLRTHECPDSSLDPPQHLLLLVFASSLAGCDLKLPGDYDELTFEQRPYLGGEIRTDGYWYYTYFTPEGEGPFHSVHFFYRNGVVRYGGAGPSLEELETIALNDRDTPRYYWGLLHVTGDQIAFERWYPAEYVSAFVRSGHIVNDHPQRGWLLYSSRRPLKGDRALTRTDRSWPAAAPVSSPPAPDTERSAGSDPRSNPPCSQSTLATRNDCPNTASSADGGSS